jgi:hypothetical protein
MQVVTQMWPIIYRIGCDTQALYIQLHKHNLNKCFDSETECDFNNAKMEIDLHASELLRPGNLYSSRIQMLCAVYAYLRDQSEKSFHSDKLQEKRQALQLAAMKKQASQMEDMLKKMNDAIKNQGKNGGNNKKPMCWHCQQ